MTSPPLTLLTEREGVAGIALLAMHSDGIIAMEEDERLRAHLSTYPLFEDAGEGALGEILSRIERVAREHGDAALLEMSCAAVSVRLAPTAFMVAVDVVVADGEVAPDESEYVADLQKRLGIPEARAEAIIQAVLIRNES